MKKLQIVLYTLLAVCASLDVHAMEPGRTVEHTVDKTSTARQNDHQLTDAQKVKASKDSQKQIEHDAKSGNATEEKYTQRIKELTDSSEPLTSSQAQELAKNQESLKTVQNQKTTSGISLEKTAEPSVENAQKDESSVETDHTDSLKTGIPLPEGEASPAVDKTEKNESNTETDRTDSTDSLKTVDLTDEVTAQAQAQNVKDSSTLTSFIKSMVDSFFGKDANNPEIQDATDQAMSDAQAEQWWSPWDGSKFQRWFDNTMESFKQIKASLPTALLFSSTGTGSAMAAQVSSANFNYDSRADSVYKDDISTDPWSSRDSIRS